MRGVLLTPTRLTDSKEIESIAILSWAVKKVALAPVAPLISSHRKAFGGDPVSRR